MKYSHDLIIIGGGSAGLSLASVAARLGVKVALIDKEDLGGDCLHYGCVPSKTLIHSAKVAHLAKTGSEYGVHAQGVHVDFPVVTKRIQSVIDTIADHVDNADRFRSLGCDVWTQTEATFVDAHTVDVGTEKITAKKIAICAGTRPATVPIEGLQEVGYSTNETVFKLEKSPKKLIIIGSGPIGCELAQAFQRLDTQVVLCNRSDRLLGKEDEDVQQFMRDVFTKEDIELQLGIEMQKVTQSQGQKVLHFEKDGKQQTVEADDILVAVGRTSNADTLALENAGIELDKQGYIHTDAKLRTSQKHIYAAGDITGHLQFTHSASHEAGVIVSNALLHWPSKVNLDAIPWATFTNPEVASVGVNEARAQQKGMQYTVHKFPFSHQDRALAEGENHGFIKLILGKRDKLLGCQIVGPNAGELIHEWIVSYNSKGSIKDISRIVHVYPTLAMANQQAAGDYLGGKFFTPKVRGWLRTIFGYRNEKIDANT